MAAIRLTVNGTPRTLEADPGMPLLWALRDLLALTGTRFGCGEGLCGACTVHLDGEPVRACKTTLKDAEGRRVTTIEGLAADASHPVQRAWLAEQVPMCGWCTSGQLMEAAALIARKPSPTDAEIAAAMEGVICRCGTYPRVRAAFRRLVKEGAR